METIGNRFEGRRALITGAGSGIGRATAQRLAAEGASVYCVDLNEQGTAETVEQIEQAGGQAHAGRCDVSQSSDCDASVAAAVDALGGLDVLCNIAGILHYGHTDQQSDEQWQRVIDVNLNGTFFMCRAALPHLKHERGAIVNLASLAGIQAVPFGAAYCASKGAVLMLTKALAVEYAKSGPRVNCLCPGGIATPLVKNFALPEGADPTLFSHVMPRMPTMGKPGEVAALIAFAASDEARFVTGSAFTIDGGQGA